MVSIMLLDKKNLDEHVMEMKNLGEVLISHSHPQVPIHDDQIINVLKMRDIYVDGYYLVTHYNKCDYNTHYLQTLQIFSKNTPFLPFNLVCKIAKRFLGEEFLSLVEVFANGKRVYCWTLISDRKGNPILNPECENGEGCNYRGFEYVQMNPKYVNFY